MLRNAMVGVGGCVRFPGKEHYKGVRFNIISVTRGSMGVKCPGKKRYATLQWLLSASCKISDACNLFLSWNQHV